MTVLEWFDALQWIHIALIVTILLVFAGYVYLLVKVTRLEFVGGLVGKRKIRVFGILFGSLVVVYLFYNLYNIQPNGWVEISLLAGLVAATGTLALVTLQQADASVKMAERTQEQTKILRETVSLSIRPSISMNVLGTNGGNNYPFEPPDNFVIELQNTGKGSARNLVVTCEAQDKKVEYSKIELSSLNVGDKSPQAIRRTPDTSDDKLKVAYVLLKALYNDELGEIWSTTTQIDKNDKWEAGEITPPIKILGDNDD